jgi:predicted transcriptional regulator
LRAQCEALELLKLISERAPGNVQELATLCGRSQPSVSRS